MFNIPIGFEITQRGLDNLERIKRRIMSKAVIETILQALANKVISDFIENVQTGSAADGTALSRNEYETTIWKMKRGWGTKTLVEDKPGGKVFLNKDSFNVTFEDNGRTVVVTLKETILDERGMSPAAKFRAIVRIDRRMGKNYEKVDPSTNPQFVVEMSREAQKVINEVIRKLMGV